MLYHNIRKVTKTKDKHRLTITKSTKFPRKKNPHKFLKAWKKPSHLNKSFVSHRKSIAAIRAYAPHPKNQAKKKMSLLTSTTMI